MGPPRIRFRTLAAPPPPPKIWPAAAGAWQIRLPLPWQLASVNVFLFKRGDGYFLLDSGIRTEESLQSLEVSLATVGADWGSIGEILVSHLHPDHIGAAAELRRRCAAPVRMPLGESDLVRPLGPHRKYFAEAAAFLLDHGVPRVHVEEMRRAAAAGSHTSERIDVDGGIAGGERIEFDGGTLEAVPAPGHSPSQLCFYCREQRVLFSTDAILPAVTPNIGVHWFYQDDPLGDYLQTLSALHQLEVDRVVPSHGRPFQGHREWIENTRQHHRNRCDSIAETLDGEPKHAYAIAGEVWGEERNLLDRRFAMAESLSHLHYMALEGRVSRILVDGVTHWTRP